MATIDPVIISWLLAIVNGLTLLILIFIAKKSIRVGLTIALLIFNVVMIFLTI